MSKPRMIVAVALASGTFGGMIGALSTAAIQSQAAAGSAASAQQVQDTQAEHALDAIQQDAHAICHATPHTYGCTSHP